MVASTCIPLHTSARLLQSRGGQGATPVQEAEAGGHQEVLDLLSDRTDAREAESYL